MKYSVLCVIFSSIFLIDFVYSAVTLSAVKQDGVELVTFSLGKTIEVACNATSSDKKENVEVEWKQNGVKVEDVESLKGRYKIKPPKKGTIYKLEINSAKEDDIGNYTCSVDDKEVEIPVFTKPLVKLPTNLNTVETESLRIPCIVYGKPYSELTWYYSNETMNETEISEFQTFNDRITLEEDPEKGIEDAILVISNVQMWDRGEYTCLATPPHGHRLMNATTMVRVKGKYAALWPFIGICIEVVVLCGIILIYEKKRNKTELEESDTDQSPDQKNTPDHNKDSNLRHRQ